MRLTGPLGGKLGFLGEKDGCFFPSHCFPTPKKVSQVEKLLWISNVKDRFFGNDDGKLEHAMEIGFSSTLRPSNLD